jgi:hypothetical protein
MSRLLIDSLLSNGTLTMVYGGYKCECSENTLKRDSIRSHVNTKKHLRWVNADITPPIVPSENGVISEEKDECTICYEIKGVFFGCVCCSQTHCMECHSKMEKCPFCRTRFKVVPARRIRSITREEALEMFRIITLINNFF